MTVAELKEKLAEVLDETPEDVDVFISIINLKTGEGECLGHGCGGCHTQEVAKLHGQGFYKHTHEILHPEDSDKVH